MEGRGHSNVLDVRSFRGADFDTDRHYMLVTEVRERLCVSKRTAQKFDMGIFNLKKINEMEVRQQYQLQISNRLAVLWNLDDSMDLNRTWEIIKENIKISAKKTSGQ
jgi:hypothetical protein